MTPAGAPLHGFLRLLVAALPLFGLALPARADSTKPAASLPSSAVPAASALIPTPRPKADTSLTLAPVDAYMGLGAVITPRVTFSGGPAENLRWVVPTCRFEIRFPSLPDRTLEAPCNKPINIDVPDDRHYDSTGLGVRVLAGADLNASAWASAKLSVHAGPTLLEIRHVTGQLPANLAAAASITAAEDVFVTLYKTLPTGANRTPLPNRPVVVTVTGGQATAVPTSSASGNISFQVVHVKSVTPSVHVLFQGDTAYASSHASATLTPASPHKGSWH